MGSENLIIRADASARIGSGHIMRCLALAQAWEDDSGTVTFIISEESLPFRERLEAEGCEVVSLDAAPGSGEDARTTAAVGSARGAVWLAIDGYHFPASYRRRCAQTGLKILWIDDCGHGGRCCADIVLNQNAYASVADYPAEPAGARLLLGPKYLLLRREFALTGGGAREAPGPVRAVLVTLGGSDPENVCAGVLEALAPLIPRYGLAVTAVLGKMNPHTGTLMRRFRRGEGISFVHDAPDMPRLIAGADIAVTGAGTTSGEIAFLGTPMIAVILGENQKRVGEALHAAGAALLIRDGAAVGKALPGLIRSLITSPERRRALSVAAARLVDGAGAARVIMHMKERAVRLRKVLRSDCRLLWVWANDPGVRETAFNREPIALETHIRWFEERLASPACSHYIALDADDTPIGQVRFDRTGAMAEVDISVDRSHRGRGLGQEILRLGMKRVRTRQPGTGFHAYVRAENTVSAGMFRGAGFTLAGRGVVRGADVYEFVVPEEPPRGEGDP